MSRNAAVGLALACVACAGVKTVEDDGMGGSRGILGTELRTPWDKDADGRLAVARSSAYATRKDADVREHVARELIAICKDGQRVNNALLSAGQPANMGGNLSRFVQNKDGTVEYVYVTSSCDVAARVADRGFVNGMYAVANPGMAGAFGGFGPGASDGMFMMDPAQHTDEPAFMQVHYSYDPRTPRGEGGRGEGGRVPAAPPTSEQTEQATAELQALEAFCREPANTDTGACVQHRENHGLAARMASTPH